jgi:hypothetical protein
LSEKDFSQLTVTGFKKCCISNALNGTENNFLFQDEEDKDSDCEDGGGDDEE